MSYFEWINDFSVGVAAFDAEHKQLIGYINRLYDAVADGKAESEIANVLGGLVDYTVNHFAHEEDMMRQYDYPDFESHKNHHDSLFVKVNEYRSRFSKERSAILPELMEFMKGWLMVHIKETDKKYSAFFSGKSIS